MKKPIYHEPYVFDTTNGSRHDALIPLDDIRAAMELKNTLCYENSKQGTPIIW